MTTCPRPSDRVCRDLPELLEVAKLSAGEGAGAGFPVGRIVAAAQAIGADLIVNGCDRELGSGKNAYVLTAHLAEVAAGAAAITSGSVRYAVPRGTEVHDVLRRAAVPVLPVPDRNVGRDDASLVSLAQGGLARPMTDGAPFIFGGTDPAGESIKPTVVLSAESVWLVAQILSNGPQWFRSLGWPTEPGPRLVTIGGTAALGVPADTVPGGRELPRGGVFETRTGVSFGGLLEAAGASRLRTRAVLVGGLAGNWLSAGSAWRSQWSTDSLSPFGVSPSASVVTVLQATQCPVCVVGAMLDHAASQSAAQCGPCRCGVSPLAREWRALAQGEGSSLAQVERRLSLLATCGGCQFSAGLATFAASSLWFFGCELVAHAATMDARSGAGHGAGARSHHRPPTASTSSGCTSEPLRPTPPPMTITSGHNRWARFTTAAPAAHIVKAGRGRGMCGKRGDLPTTASGCRWLIGAKDDQQPWPVLPDLGHETEVCRVIALPVEHASAEGTAN